MAAIGAWINEPPQRIKTAGTGQLSGKPDIISITAKSVASGNLPNGSYKYQVAAIDANGNRALGSTQSYNQLDSQNSSPEVKWTAVPGAAQYQLYRTSANSGAFTPNSLVATLTAPTTTFFDQIHTLQPGFPGYDTSSNVWDNNPALWIGLAEETAIPNPPTAVNATAGNALVNLSWSVAAGADFYTVKFATTAGGPYNAAATNITGTTYQHTGRTNGTRYYYVVSASNENGTSANSSEVSVVPAAPSVPPAIPTNLVANAGNGFVSLTWSAVSGAASYTVKSATTSGGPYTVVQSGIGPASYTHTGRTNGTTYFYVVSAQNSAGTSPDSGQASATPVAPVTQKPCYFGRSTAPKLTSEAAVKALASQDDLDFAGTYACGSATPSNYVFLAWPQAFGGPTAPNGIMLSPGTFPASMADGSVSYGTNTLNGYAREIVTVNGEPYVIYRTYYELGGDVTLIVS